MAPSSRDDRRKREAKAKRAHEAVKREGAAAARPDPETARRERIRVRRRRRIVSRSLFVAAGVVGVQHLGFHLAGSASGLSDVLVGYPTAIGLLVAGGIALGPA